MHYFSNEISTGNAVNAAFRSYEDNTDIADILENNTDWATFQGKYNNAYEALSEKLGSSFLIVDDLLNNLRAMHELESELFYRIGIRDGAVLTRGNVILDNLGGE